METSATQAAASSAANTQIQFTLLAKQLNVVKQQGQQMVESQVRCLKRVMPIPDLLETRVPPANRQF